jgi:hypothetical protein
MPLPLIPQLLLLLQIGTMLALVAVLPEMCATARQRGTDELDTLSAWTVVGRQGHTPHESFVQHLAMEVSLVVQCVNHCLRLFKLAAPEKGSTHRVKPSIVTFPANEQLISRARDVVVSGPRSMPVLTNRRQMQLTGWASHRVTGSTRGAVRMQNRRGQGVACSM